MCSLLVAIFYLTFIFFVNINLTLFCLQFCNCLKVSHCKMKFYHWFIILIFVVNNHNITQICDTSLQLYLLYCNKNLKYLKFVTYNFWGEKEFWVFQISDTITLLIKILDKAIKWNVVDICQASSLSHTTVPAISFWRVQNSAPVALHWMLWQEFTLFLYELAAQIFPKFKKQS